MKEEWIKRVEEVKRIRDMEMRVKLVKQKGMVNVISTSTPQTRCSDQEEDYLLGRLNI